MSNAMFVIAPFWDPTTQTRVFDDLPTGLVAEPFVAGITEMIDMLLAEKGFPAREQVRIIFSDAAFPDYDEEITLVGDSYGGGTYSGVSGEFADAMGWLCPALHKYFGDDYTPNSIFVKFEQLSPEAA